ncbi:DNA-directed primase/polymerase protein [Bombus impatiens]|uniref:DNA-directed primase/polymerase protein n=1 Tax=Bombus impatiens TaxID=132113 RepID=A0A6P8LIP2_BOMIM|nr:DNA-directed primase/polymerase protein [Bombus impatiens]
MSGIDFQKFYDSETVEKVEKQETNCERKVSKTWVKKHRKMPSSILGPPDFWMKFDKQVDALNTASKESNDYNMLCTFVYQECNGYRKFIVAHPEIYWWHYEHLPAERRCSYEIIPENQPCRLYLDLEYSIELNSEHDGPSMTNILIDIFCMYLLKHWRIICNRYNVINLDSSTDEKFSRHVIFNIRDVAFRDNYHVGRLVKSICMDILDYVSSKEKQHDILTCFDRMQLEGLIVETKKGKRLFVDTAVYTKNRHFRIYKSTKWGKQSNLVVSNDCKYICSSAYNDNELSIFLDSLISYFDTKKGLILLEWSGNCVPNTNCFKDRVQQCSYQESGSACSNFPMLDKYVNNLISPGKIRICKHYEYAKILVYETVGYRYCENIGRCHKSNNVLWIVNLKNKMIYQKCHDPDCFGFKSQPKQLPEEIYFQIDEEGDTFLSSVITEDIV